MIARGKTRVLLRHVGTMFDLIAEASNQFRSDNYFRPDTTNNPALAQKKLAQAMALCQTILNTYDPID